MEAVIDAAGLWTGEPDRDAHLKSPDFLDVANFPTIDFKSQQIDLIGPTDAEIRGNVTIRGTTQPLSERLGQRLNPLGPEEGNEVLLREKATECIDDKQQPTLSESGALDENAIRRHERSNGSRELDCASRANSCGTPPKKVSRSWSISRRTSRRTKCSTG